MRAAVALLVAGLLAHAPSGAQPAADDAAATGAAGAVSVVSDAVSAEAESARLRAWLDARFKDRLDFSPMQRTRLGLKEGYDEIDDFSEEAFDRELEWQRQTVEALRTEFDYARLTTDAQTSYDLWLYQYERAAAARPFLRHGFIFTQLDGPQASLPQFLISFHAVEDAVDMEAYVARIGGIARAIGQLLERAQIAASEGVRPPRFAYEAVRQQAAAIVTGAPFEGEGSSPLWGDSLAKIEALVERQTITAMRAAALRASVRVALLEQLAPAYRALIDWIDADIDNADAIATGVGKLPDGEAYYAERLMSSTTMPLTAAQIHQTGLEQVGRIRAEMEQIKSHVGFDGSLDEFFAFVRDDEQFYFPSTDAGREAYLEEARAHLARIEQRLPEFFGVLPTADLVVRRVEPFREQAGGAQHYVPGSPDGARPGVFYAHLVDMAAVPRPQLEVIAYHEGVPGHHMQISIMQELDDVPEFRTQSFFTAYVEGWGLYAERLAKEMGAYEDPYADFGRLTTEIWRAIRLVLDTGLHAMGWTEEEAVEYFRANSPASEGQIRSEVRRYIVWPGQATAYTIGMLELMRLRAVAEQALGDEFDLRAFHDTVLGGGALPLPILEQRVESWLAEQAESVSEQPAP